MNRKQRVAMIVKLLLLPFTREPFPAEGSSAGKGSGISEAADQR